MAKDGEPWAKRTGKIAEKFFSKSGLECLTWHLGYAMIRLTYFIQEK